MKSHPSPLSAALLLGLASVSAQAAAPTYTCQLKSETAEAYGAPVTHRSTPVFQVTVGPVGKGSGTTVPILGTPGWQAIVDITPQPLYAPDGLSAFVNLMHPVLNSKGEKSSISFFQMGTFTTLQNKKIWLSSGQNYLMEPTPSVSPYRAFELRCTQN